MDLTMNTLWWGLTILLLVVGLVGTVVPLLPGHVLILGAAVLHHFMLGEESGVGWVTLIILTGLMLVGLGVDLISGALGAKYFGATRWGAIGGIIGGIAGLFFGLIGVFVGPLIGVLVGELIGGKGLLPATHSTWGTVLGTTAGMLVKLFIGALMVGIFLIAALT